MKICSSHESQHNFVSLLTNLFSCSSQILESSLTTAFYLYITSNSSVLLALLHTIWMIWPLFTMSTLIQAINCHLDNCNWLTTGHPVSVWTPHTILSLEYPGWPFKKSKPNYINSLLKNFHLLAISLGTIAKVFKIGLCMIWLSIKNKYLFGHLNFSSVSLWHLFVSPVSLCRTSFCSSMYMI